MALTIVSSLDERLVNTDVVQALNHAVQAHGSAVLLVPSASQAVEVRRELAATAGLSLSVTVSTPALWAKDTWELWGDGRAVASTDVISVLAHETLRDAPEEERGTLPLLPGTVQVLTHLVAHALPWLPVDHMGSLDVTTCEQAGLTHAETCLARLAGRVARLLEEKSFVSPATVAQALPRALHEQGALPPQLAIAGFSWMSRADRELVCALACHTRVLVMLRHFSEFGSQQTEAFSAYLQETMTSMGADVNRRSGEPPSATLRSHELQELLDALFSDRTLTPNQAGPIELLLPAGPVAEAELLAIRIQELLDASPTTSYHVVIAVPDVGRACRELVPKLAERGISTRVQYAQSLSENAHAQAFLGYVAEVARLSDLAATWPEDSEGIEGPVPRLGDMSWWPPSELIDFLFEDMACMEPERVWRLDATWRGNRLLTPARVLQMLQSEKLVSAPVARATFELLRGRIGSAASKLLAPYGTPSSATSSTRSTSSQAVLVAILQLASTLRALGVTYDPNHPQSRPLSEVVSLLLWATDTKQMVERFDTGKAAASPQVTVLSVDDAACLSAASADALFLCGLTSTEQPVEGKEDVLQAMLERLGVEPTVAPLDMARTRFRALAGAARSRIVLERTLADSEGKPTYPSVMCSELLSVYDISASASPDSLPLGHVTRSERALAQNLSRLGTDPSITTVDGPAPAGQLTEGARGLVFVPQAGKNAMPNDLPVLSASQIETYLDCPYKWFSLRRLRLGVVDAGHTGMEMGTFAHRVLELTHQELLARALEREAQDSANRESLLAELQEHPCRSVPGSRLEEAGLPEAQEVLSQLFDLHLEHMYLERNPRASQQLLVAHNSAEHAQEQQLKEDLLSSLAYQTHILAGFEPRYFEWGFGRHDDLVPYGGAYFTGMVDRIDVSPHGTAVIIDYKHKSPNGFALEYDALQDGVLEGTALPSRVQSLIYAQVVRRHFEGDVRLVGSVYLSTKSPHALAGVADENIADLVFGNLSSRRLPRVCIPARDDGSPGMNDLLDRTEELIAEQVEQMLAGNVEARPRDRHSCDYCPVMQCERRVAR